MREEVDVRVAVGGVEDYARVGAEEAVADWEGFAGVGRVVKGVGCG